MENVINFRIEAQPFIDRKRAWRGIRESDDMQFDEAARYLTGKRASMNLRRAFLGFLAAAQRGDVEAALVVGYMYANGKGARMSCVEARNWLCTAGNLGIEEVKFAMARRCTVASTHIYRLRNLQPGATDAKASTKLKSVRQK